MLLMTLTLKLLKLTSSAITIMISSTIIILCLKAILESLSIRVIVDLTTKAPTRVITVRFC